ncbi:MAG: TonB-dependent receptor [Gammaproteobacteria bacterium]|nr:TonB-dependent receptor [Gammaproteobacteria bacterium]
MRMRSALTGLALSFCGSAALAGGPGPETIIVTAAYLPRPIDQVGSAVSVVTREDIDDRQAVVVADVLRGLPGISIARSGPVGSQTQLRMRGAESNHVLVLIDGVPANNLAGADEFAFEHLHTLDIERIEVVRGPQSALWGSDALAGVINVLSRRPVQGLQAEARLEGGSFDTWNGGAWAGASNGRGHASLSVSRFDSSGTNASRSGDEDDGYDNTTVSLGAGYALTPSLQFDLSYRRTSAGKDFDNASIFTGLPADDANGDGLVDTYHSELRQDYLRASLGWDPLDGRWIHQLRYGITDTETHTQAEDLYAPGVIDHTRQDGHKTGVYYQSSIRLRSDAQGNPLDVLSFAVDHQRETYRQRGPVSSYDFDDDGIADLVYDPNQSPSMHRTGYVAEYLASLGAHLNLSVGLRHDDYSDFDSANTWRTTASWRPRGGASRLHASLGKGVKTPTFIERFGYFAQQFAGNPALRPERSLGWDIGIEKSFADGQVVADLSYFRADLEGEIDGNHCCTNGMYTAVNRSGSSHRSGVELSVRAELSDVWTLDAAYTYTDSNEPVASGDRQRELRRPRHSAGLNLDGKWWSGRLGFHAALSHTGQRLDDFFDASFTPHRVQLGSYTLLTLAGHYELSPAFSIHARVENALGESYEDVYGFNTPGAAAYLGLRVAMQR